MEDITVDSEAAARSRWSRLRRREAAVSPWYLLGVALVIQFGFAAADQGVPLLAGFVKADLGTSATITGLAVSSFLFGKIFGSYLGGAAADRVGEREILVYGGWVSAALIIVAATTPLTVLFPLLAVAGFASAAATPAGGRLVLMAFPPARRGLALGIRQTGIPIAGLVVAVILPTVAHTGGWRWSLVVIAVIMACSVIPLYRTTVPRTEARRRPSRATPHVARNVNLRLLTIWGCLAVTGQFAVVTYLALDLHARARMSLPAASLLVAVAQGAGIVGRILWGVTSDRLLSHGRKPLLVAVNVIGLFSALLLFVTPRPLPLVVLILIAILAGLALIGYQGLWVTMVTEAVGPENVGAATGFAVTFVVAAAALSPPLYGFVADAAGTYRAVWAALSVSLAIAIVPALLIRRD